jgi:hypothetical protein
MSSVSSVPSDLVTSVPPRAEARPRSLEAIPGLVVLALLLAAIVWAAIAQVRSPPSPADVGPEAAMMTIVD